MTPSRETISAALATLIDTAPSLKSVSRKFRHWDQVPAAEQPAGFLVEPSESIAGQSENTPRKHTLAFDLWVYSREDDPNEPGVTIQNNILDEIETAIAPSGRDLMFGRQTLGGIVSHVFIDGDILKINGDVDKQALLLVPLRILVP